MEEKKKGRGGARPGAGRKGDGIKRDAVLTVRLQRDFFEKLKLSARNEGKTLAGFIEQHLRF